MEKERPCWQGGPISSAFGCVGEQDPLPKPPKRRYIVTKTETTVVEARNPEQAAQLGDLKIDFNGADTTDIDVELKED